MAPLRHLIPSVPRPAVLNPRSAPRGCQPLVQILLRRRTGRAVCVQGSGMARDLRCVNSTNVHCKSNPVLTIFASGPIIRIAPDEVHINDVDFLDEIYGTAGRRIEKSYKSIGGLNVPNAMAATVSHDLHRKRRDAVAGIFTMKSVRTMEPLFREKIGKLCGILEGSMGKTKVNISDLYYCFCRE